MKFIINDNTFTLTSNDYILEVKYLGFFENLENCYPICFFFTNGGHNVVEGKNIFTEKLALI